MKRPLSTAAAAAAAIATAVTAAAVSSPDALVASAAAAPTNTSTATASGHSRAHNKHRHRIDDGGGGTNADPNGGTAGTYMHGRAEARAADVSGGGTITLGVNPTAGSDLLRKLSAAAAADAAAEDAAVGEDNNNEQHRRRRRLVDAIGGGQGVYGLLEEIVLLPVDDEEDGNHDDDGDNGKGRDDDAMHVSEDTNSKSDTRTSAVTVDPALLQDLGLSPADVRRHNARVRTFRRHRHLSRFERQYRLENGLDLELGMEVDVEGDVADDQDGAKDGDDGDGKNQNIRRNLLVHTPYNGVHPYQTTPLSQGYGTHYATVYVGTPPQRKSVIVDTGSHYTAFPCAGCANCGEEHRE